MAKLKRLRAPKFWHVEKKAYKLVVAPSPGPHKKFECLPLQIILRDILKEVETGKEAKTVLNKGEVAVDGVIRKNRKYPAGFMDAIAIPKLKKYFRVVITAKGLDLIEISEKESKLKLCRIENKKVLKEGKVQLNLHDGKNILVSKDVYKTGDTLLVELPKLKIVDHVKMEDGNLCLITKGKSSGKIAKLKEIIITRTREPNKIICELDKKKIEAMKEHVFVVGKDKELIKLSE
jgi:small subunit ribosomal protein S4e